MARKAATKKKDPAEAGPERNIALVRLSRSRVLVARDRNREVVATGEEQMIWAAIRDRLAPDVTVEMRELGRWVPATVERMRRLGEMEPERFVGAGG